MSNRVYLLATKFVDSTGESFGFRVSDEYDKAYWNMGESLIENDLALLQTATDASEFEQFREFLVSNEMGLTINDTWYDWDEVKDILKFD